MIFMKDHLCTDTYLVRGHVTTGEHRLSTFLNKMPRQFLDVEAATLIRHCGGERMHVPEMKMHMREILFAYETENTGDDVLRSLAESAGNKVCVTAQFSGIMPLQITGKVYCRVLDSMARQPHGFIVMMEPVLRGFAENPGPEYDTVRNMPYAILNTNRIAFLYRQDDAVPAR